MWSDMRVGTSTADGSSPDRSDIGVGDATRPGPPEGETRASSDLPEQGYLAATTLTVTFAATSW